jgi:hypothetical protein
VSTRANREGVSTDREGVSTDREGVSTSPFRLALR